MARFFIDRPVFAWVIAIVIMVVGSLSVLTLPIAQYPTIAPPAVSISASYPGASAETVQNSVTQVIEQQLTSIDNLLYFSSSSSSSGQVNITATFAPGTNPDIAQVQVQNKLAQATALLPTEVQQQGVVVQKSQPSFLLAVALYDTGGRYTNGDISDFLTSHLQDPLSRVSGVGSAQVFGSQYAMRIWLNPLKLATYSLVPSDVSSAILAQNTQVAAGELGSLPAASGQELDATVTAQSELQTPEQFRNIILKTNSNGAVVRLGDVARVELGPQDYSNLSRMNGFPASGIAIKLAPGANALTTADAVKAKAESLIPTFPPGIKLAYPVDNTGFIRLSIQQVIKTLVEAIFLVVAVMFVFLQEWRATLIPAIAVPVVLLGTFGVLAAAGFTINTLTLFALVLAIGLLVDDAIVVVENVERIMREEGLPPREATRKSMDEITGALIGIALVLSAVFLPMAFFGGSTGAIYRQFSITIISAMSLSILVALVVTPALCATILKPIPEGGAVAHGAFFRWFNRTFEAVVARYQTLLEKIFGNVRPALFVYAGIVALLVVLFYLLPTGFLPEEDQGTIITQIQLPTGATQPRAFAVAKQVEHFFLVDEKKNVAICFVVLGFSFAGQGQNTGIVFVHLKDWSERGGYANSAEGIVRRARQVFSKIRDARVFPLVPPAVQELGNTSGFDLELEDRGGLGHQALEQAQGQLMGLAAHDPLLTAVRPNSLPDTPQLHVNINEAEAQTLGLTVAEINNTLSAAWGSQFVNQFIDRGRVKFVFMEGDAPFRMKPDDLNDWYVRNSAGTMTPFSSFANYSWQMGPATLTRYNGLPSLEIQGQAAPGQSSGTAMTEIAKLISKLPKGVGFEWTGLSFQEVLSGTQAPALYGLSVLIVFLCLAALYESWSVPFSVLLIIPLGVAGAVLAVTLRSLFNEFFLHAQGFYNDVFFQVGLLTTIGLSSKNAILIVEFAETAARRGVDYKDAARQAARLRLRPILMTSLAFIAGVAPLAVATGAGAASQTDIGTGVIGGMLAATALAVFFVPMFFELVRSRFHPPAKPAD